MQVGKVIGNVWATRKEDKLAGLKLLIVQPVNITDASGCGVPLVAADTIGAGAGELVLFVSGSSARAAAGGEGVPVDAVVVGIIDGMEIDHTVVI